MVNIPGIRYVAACDIMKARVGRTFSTIKSRFDTKINRYLDAEEMLEKEITSYAKAKSIVYLEFGVWEGNSIIHLANKLDNPNHKFYGFDSFLGLPES